MSVQEVHLNLAYRWFCRLGLEDKVPDHSSFLIYAKVELPLRSLQARVLLSVGAFANSWLHLTGHELHTR
jgi:IS5 family transposase